MYNFKSVFDVSGKEITLGSFLGDALALVQLQVLADFEI